MNEVDRILTDIASLSPRERAVLWRRAVALGLLDPAVGDRRPSAEPGGSSTVRLGLMFDGGSRGNPGPGYGSYAFLWPGRPPEVHRLRFGRLTNNEAEYDALIAALEALLSHLAREGIDPQRVDLEVLGDSRLVINQLNGVWRVRKDHLRARWQKARSLLDRFGRVVLRHQPRERSVAVLGH
ncbi:MAG: reverse transcriptase-like protein [Chloroflexi bacterium]|nr:reverse transcriptase-like protein [Chloroflexota bacterium]